MATRVVHCQHHPYDIYIGRAKGVRGQWGNPFVVGRDGTRAEVIARYRNWLLTQPQLVAQLPTLRGKVLGCWCKQRGREIPCHGDVLAALADALPV